MFLPCVVFIVFDQDQTGDASIMCKWVSGNNK